MANNLVGILLAAGKSTRFGSNKLLHLLPDTQQAIAVQSARNLMQALPNSIAVVRPEDSELKSLLSKTGIQIIDNPVADAGLSSSIRCGVELSTAEKPQNASILKGWIVALADMPYILPDVYLDVASKISGGAMICAPEYQGKRGHPVGFSYRLIEEILTLQGDEGARSLLVKYTSQLTLINASTDGILKDIDSPEDLG